MARYLNEWMKEWKKEWMNEWMNERLYLSVNGIKLKKLIGDTIHTLKCILAT